MLKENTTKSNTRTTDRTHDLFAQQRRRKRESVDVDSSESRHVFSSRKRSSSSLTADNPEGMERGFGAETEMDEMRGTSTSKSGYGKKV